MNARFFRAPGFSLTQRVRHAVSDLVSRRGTTALNALSVCVAVLFLLLLGYLALSLYRYRSATVSEFMLGRIIVSSRDATDPSQRLTEAQQAALAARFGVARVFAKIEVGGRVWRDPASTVPATCEGTIADDPATAHARLAWGRSPATLMEVAVPLPLFEKLGGRLTASGPSDNRLTFEVRRTTAGREEAHVLALQIVGLLKTTDETMFIPLPQALALDQWCTHSIERMPGADGRIETPRFTPESVLAFGPVDQAGRVADEANQLGVTVRKIGEFESRTGPAEAWIDIDSEDPKDVVSRMAALADVRSFVRLHVRREIGGRTMRWLVLTPEDPLWGSNGGSVPAEGVVLSNSNDASQAAVGPFVKVADATGKFGADCDFLCTPATFTRLILADAGLLPLVPPYRGLSPFRYGSIRRPAKQTTAEVAVQVPEIHLTNVLRETGAAGMKVRPLTANPVIRLASYELKPRSSGSKTALDLTTAVRFAQPTFVEAVPVVRATARCGRSEVRLEGTIGTDPRRFSAGLLRGSWPGESGFDVVLPAAAVATLFTDAPPAECTGREVTLTFDRDRAGSDFDRTLAITARLVGVTEKGPGGFVSAEFAGQVNLWAAGKVAYSASRRSFEPPAALYARAGAARCNLDVTDPDRAAEVVARLKADGYPVAHRLAEQQGQQKMARVLVLMVGVLVGGYLISGLITVFASNAQQIAGKVYEIGLLRSLGMGTREVVQLYALQGLFTGAAAFFIGTGLALAIEPLLSRTLLTTFGLPAEVLPSRLFHFGNAALFGGAFLVSLGASTLGAIVPAMKAAKIDPVDAMRRVG